MGLCESCKNNSCGYASEDVIRCGDFEENLVQTNADRIRAMTDEGLATQLVQVFKEGIKVLTNMDMPEELLDKFWNSFLERLKQPAEERQ